MRIWERGQPFYCGYCGAHVDHGRPETAAGWATVAEQHLDGCEWVLTRGHTLCPACAESSGACWLGTCPWTVN